LVLLFWERERKERGKKEGDREGSCLTYKVASFQVPERNYFLFHYQSQRLLPIWAAITKYLKVGNL
jgi:hypothetical protein